MIYLELSAAKCAYERKLIPNLIEKLPKKMAWRHRDKWRFLTYRKHDEKDNTMRTR